MPIYFKPVPVGVLGEPGPIIRVRGGDAQFIKAYHGNNLVFDNETTGGITPRRPRRSDSVRVFRHLAALIIS